MELIDRHTMSAVPLNLYFFSLTSSAERSIKTHKLQMTHKAAAKWKSTAQKSRRRSTPDISKLLHYNVTKIKKKWI